jgi:hypothetical protein
MEVVINSKFCEFSLGNGPLSVCATHSALLMACNISSQMHNFIVGPFSVDKYIINAHLQKGLT